MLRLKFEISSGADGTVDVDDEELAKCETLEEAIDYAREMVDEFVCINVVGLPEDADVEELWKEARATHAE